MQTYKNSNFKYLEWFQHILTRKFEEFYKKQKQEEKNRIWEIAIPIFSLIGTYSITMITKGGLTFVQVLGYVCLPFIFLGFCWGSKIIVNSKLIIKLKEFFIKNKIYSLTTDDIECKYKIKEFNNIVCNNVLLSYTFIVKYEENENINIKTYYYNEIQHYLMEAIDKLNTMINSQFIEKILKISVNDEQKIIKKIRIDRVDNVLEMIDEILNFLNMEISEVESRSKRNIVSKELENMQIDFDNMKRSYDDYVDEKLGI